MGLIGGRREGAEVEEICYKSDGEEGRDVGGGVVGEAVAAFARLRGSRCCGEEVDRGGSD